MPDLSEINFHDSRILRVTEITESDILVMDVDYPIDYLESKYEKKQFVFTDAYNYQVHEQPFFGSPVVLEVKVLEEENGWQKFRLETNAGFREIHCKGFKLA